MGNVARPYEFARSIFLLKIGLAFGKLNFRLADVTCSSTGPGSGRMKGISVSITPKNSIHLDSSSAYDLWSRDYDEFENPMLAMVDEAFLKKPLILAGARVVELGCGTGRNVAKIIAAGASSYIGIDQSPKMLEKARVKHPELSFITGDILQTLPIENASVDFILVALVFEHLNSLKPTLSEISRILKPQGQLRILELHSSLHNQGTKAHFKQDDCEITIPSFSHDALEWSREIVNAQLTVVSIDSLIVDQQAIDRCRKLAKHQGKSVLFDISVKKGDA